MLVNKNMTLNGRPKVDLSEVFRFEFEDMKGLLIQAVKRGRWEN